MMIKKIRKKRKYHYNLNSHFTAVKHKKTRWYGSRFRSRVHCNAEKCPGDVQTVVPEEKPTISNI